MELGPHAGHESGSAGRPVPYGELDALRFKAELEVAQRELEDVSKKAGIAELEWEDQRKQLLATIDGISLRLPQIQFGF
jgi:tRNA A37 threonylcarbamoyladenosine biosynthesis protein TsaE